MSAASSNSVDLDQLKHLVKTAIKLDFRSSSALNTANVQSRKSKIPPLVNSMIIYVVMGGPLAMMTWAITSPFVAMLFLAMLSMAFAAINILIEFGSLIISPEDHNVISPLPVNSRTYFYSKLINLLFYTSLLTISIGIIPAIVFAVQQKSVAYVFVTFAVLLMANFAVSLATASVYTSLLNVVSREKLSSVLNYFQLGLATVVYLGYFAIPKLIRDEQQQIIIEPKLYHFLLPPGWYASIVGILGDAGSSYWIVSAAIGVLALVVLYAYASRFLSVDYAATISRAEVVSRSAQEKKEVRRVRRKQSAGVFSFMKLEPEEKAVLQLIKAQFRYDNRLKMTVLGIIPMLVIYFFLSFSETGGFPNPFVPGQVENLEFATIMVFFAIAVFPMFVQSALVYSKSYEASWVFFATPADLKTLVFAVSRFIHWLFVVPFIILCVVVFSIIFKNVPHAIGLLAVVYLLSMIHFRVLFATMPDLPFSKPLEKTRTMSRLWIVGMFLPAITVVLPIYILMRFAFQDFYIYLIALSVLILIFTLATLLARKRVEAKISRFGFSV